MSKKYRIIASIILVTFVIVFVNLPVETKIKSEIKLGEVLSFKDVQENNLNKEYPWNKKVTQVALEAIKLSINNLKRPEKERDQNFPSNPFGHQFSQTEFTNFVILGYIKKNSETYLISFRPKSEVETSGPSIAVEMNVKTIKAIQVYMVADA